MGHETPDSVKTSFKDKLAARRQVLIDSNQENLASAYLFLEQAEDAAKAHLLKLKELRDAIELAGDTEEIAKDADGSSTMALYDKAMKLARLL